MTISEEQALTRERYDLIKGIKEWKRLNSIGHLGETYCHFRETKIKDAENRVEEINEMLRRAKQSLETAGDSQDFSTAENQIHLSRDDIQKALDGGDRQKAVEIWISLQQIEERATKTSIYKKAKQHKTEYYKWEGGKLPNGSAADIAIRRVLLEDQ